MTAKKGKLRRFEYRDGKTAKFWEICVTGHKFDFSFGKIGSSGQKSWRNFVDSYAANKHAEMLIRGKLKDGYLEVVDPMNVDAAVEANMANQPVFHPPREIVKTDPIDSTVIGRHSLPGEISYLKDWACAILAVPEDDVEWDAEEVQGLLNGIEHSQYGAPVKWKATSPQEVNRRGTFVFGPNFCSVKHPWPESKGRMMRPIIQINLDELAKKFALPKGVPGGLFQIFMPSDKVLDTAAVLRLIDSNDFQKVDPTDFPILKKGKYFGESWSDPYCEIMQVAGYGKSRGYSATHAYLKNLLRSRSLMDKTKEFGFDCEQIKKIAQTYDKQWQKKDSCLMGHFSSIQYDYADVEGVPFFCISDDVWGYGNAQVFFSYKDKVPKFEFRWSC